MKGTGSNFPDVIKKSRVKMLINIKDNPKAILKQPMANILVIWLMEYLMNSSKMETHLGMRMISYLISYAKPRPNKATIIAYS